MRDKMKCGEFFENDASQKPYGSKSARIFSKMNIFTSVQKQKLRMLSKLQKWASSSPTDKNCWNSIQKTIEWALNSGTQFSSQTMELESYQVKNPDIGLSGKTVG